DDAVAIRDVVAGDRVDAREARELDRDGRRCHHGGRAVLGDAHCAGDVTRARHGVVRRALSDELLLHAIADKRAGRDLPRPAAGRGGGAGGRGGSARRRQRERRRARAQPGEEVRIRAARGEQYEDGRSRYGDPQLLQHPDAIFCQRAGRRLGESWEKAGKSAELLVLFAEDVVLRELVLVLVRVQVANLGPGALEVAEVVGRVLLDDGSGGLRLAQDLVEG